MKQYCKQGFIYLLFPLVSKWGGAVLHDCLRRPEPISGFDSHGTSDVTRDATRDATSDFNGRQNFPPIQVTSETATAKNEDQWKVQKGVGGTAKKVWGAQVRDAWVLTVKLMM